MVEKSLIILFDSARYAKSYDIAPKMLDMPLHQKSVYIFLFFNYVLSSFLYFLFLPLFSTGYFAIEHNVCCNYLGPALAYYF